MTVYEVVYLVSEIFYMYILNLYFGTFFGERRTSRWALLGTYALYILIADGEYLLINNYQLNAILSIGFIFVITLHYKASYKKRLLGMLMIYLIMAMIETIVVGLTGNIEVINEVAYQEVIGPILAKIFLFVVALLLRNFKNIKENFPVPFSYWCAIFIIPASSAYLIFNIIGNNLENFSKMQFVISISGILLINATTFYLYDAVIKYYNERMRTELLQQESDHYIQQLDNMKRHMDEMRAFRHDLRNHLEVLHSMVGKDSEGSKEYILKMSEAMAPPKQYVATGNVAVDSIINYKLEEAIANGIEVKTDISVPDNLNIEPFDWVAILGNLLDNAINATKNVEEKQIAISMRYAIGKLVLDISNSFDGTIQYDGGKLVTTKRDKSDHGYGLRNMERAIKQYQGSYEISHSEKEFRIRVVLYMKEID